MNEQSDPETTFLAILHLATESEPGPDGMLPEDVQEAIRSLSGQGEVQGQFSLEDEESAACLTYEECYGSEPPGRGWVYCGEMMWKRGRRRVADAADVRVVPDS